MTTLLRKCLDCKEVKPKAANFTKDDWTCDSCLIMDPKSTPPSLVIAPEAPVKETPQLAEATTGAIDETFKFDVSSQDSKFKLNPNAAPFTPTWQKPPEVPRIPLEPEEQPQGGLSAKLAGLRKTCWLPTVEAGEDLTLVESKFGGAPILKSGEPWPACPVCKGELSAVLQLDMEKVPAGIQKSLGNRGIFQCFLCFGRKDQSTLHCDKGGFIMRVWEPSAEEVAHKVEVHGRTDLKPKRITGWTSKDDFPGFNDALKHVKLRNKDFEEICAMRVAGDKLGGWPLWVQLPDWRKCGMCGTLMVQLFQLDSNTALEAVSWGDTGMAHLQMCPNALCHQTIGGSFGFDWSSC